MSDLTLYELEEGLVATAQYVAEMEAGGNEEDLAEALQSLEAYIKESVIKRDNCGRYLMSLDATADAIDSQIAWLQEKQKKIEKRREAFAKHMLFVMSRIGVKTLEGKVFSFKARQNPVKVIIDDEAKVPTWYKTLDEPKPPELKPDKKQIREAIEKGEEVPGAHLEQETRLVIDQ